MFFAAASCFQFQAESSAAANMRAWRMERMWILSSKIAFALAKRPWKIWGTSRTAKGFRKWYNTLERFKRDYDKNDIFM